MNGRSKLGKFIISVFLKYEVQTALRPDILFKEYNVSLKIDNWI